MERVYNFAAGPATIDQSVLEKAQKELVCYQDKGISARMTTAGKLRETLLRTQDYMLRKEAAGEDVLRRPAYDMKLEAMIPVVKGELPLKAHAHQANDILTAIRIA